MTDAGKQFLADNAKKEGVITTPSGLQYKVVKQGDGPRPAARDMVSVYYTGMLIDGKVFDKADSSGIPVSFPLNQVIAGWTEGLQLMPVGSTYVFYIPSELGYGKGGAGNVIPPNATLIFEVELVSID
jgi:FKBP-type peptidyl-prolyl cis-trans isomerase